MANSYASRMQSRMANRAAPKSRPRQAARPRPVSKLAQQAVAKKANPRPALKKKLAPTSLARTKARPALRAQQMSAAFNPAKKAETRPIKKAVARRKLRPVQKALSQAAPAAFTKSLGGPNIRRKLKSSAPLSREDRVKRYKSKAKKMGSKGARWLRHKMKAL